MVHLCPAPSVRSPRHLSARNTLFTPDITPSLSACLGPHAAPAAPCAPISGRHFGDPAGHSPRSPAPARPAALLRPRWAIHSSLSSTSPAQPGPVHRPRPPLMTSQYTIEPLPAARHLRPRDQTVLLPGPRNGLTPEIASELGPGGRRRRAGATPLSALSPSPSPHSLPLSLALSSLSVPLPCCGAREEAWMTRSLLSGGVTRSVTATEAVCPDVRRGHRRGASWVPPGCLRGASRVPLGCLRGASGETLGPAPGADRPAVTATLSAPLSRYTCCPADRTVRCTLYTVGSFGSARLGGDSAAAAAADRMVMTPPMPDVDCAAAAVG